MLAEFASPAPSVVAPAAVPQAEAPVEPKKPEPVVERPEPKPVVAEKPKTKKISTNKSAQQPPKVEEEPAAPPAAPAKTATTAATGPTGPAGSGPSMNIGGLAAYDVDSVDQRPSIASRVLPEYPSKARRMNVQGRVFVRLVVDASGSPKSCEVHKAEPAGYFEDAALAAAQKTRFFPGKVRGQAVNTVVLVPFVFALR